MSNYGEYSKDMKNNLKSNAESVGGDQQKDENIKVDGFAQIVAMLQVADPEFRESLLKRLASRDKILAQQLRRNLAELGI